MASPASSLSSPSSSLSPPLSPVHAPRKSPTPPAPPSDISSDTSGSVPGSPLPDDLEFQDQVTVCRWEGCPVGDLGDMDSLVQHIHDTHIGSRKQKYSCEWEDCGRKGMTHASGYALRAHVRSHTREKPFYCSLPECDRSFTRSDALAKHMRTVHETEALRPSDPIPKGYINTASASNAQETPTQSTNSRKRKSRGGHSERSSPSPSTKHMNGNSTMTNGVEHEEKLGASSRYRDVEDGLSEDEVQFPPKQLLAYLKKKLEVLEEEASGLQKRDSKWAEIEKRTWVEKEKTLEGVFVEHEAGIGNGFRIWKDMEKRKRIKLETIGGSEGGDMDIGGDKDDGGDEREDEEVEKRNGQGSGGLFDGNGISRLLEAARDDIHGLGEDEDGEGEDDDGDEDIDMDDDSS